MLKWCLAKLSYLSAEWNCVEGKWILLHGWVCLCSRVNKVLARRSPGPTWLDREAWPEWLIFFVFFFFFTCTSIKRSSLYCDFSLKPNHTVGKVLFWCKSRALEAEEAFLPGCCTNIVIRIRIQVQANVTSHGWSQTRSPTDTVPCTLKLGNKNCPELNFLFFSISHLVPFSSEIKSIHIQQFHSPRTCYPDISL